MSDSTTTGSEAEMLAAMRTAGVEATYNERIVSLEQDRDDFKRRLVTLETDWKSSVPGILRKLEEHERRLDLRDGGGRGGDCPPMRLPSGPMS